MKRIIVFSFLVLIMTSCTERMTKQFIVPRSGSTEDLQKAKNWNVEFPKLIAFKQKALDDIPDDSLTFWLTIRVFEDKKSNLDNLFSIDSIGLNFTEIDSTVWRVPSRIVPFRKSGKDYIAFDFFRDQGIEIPNSVTSLKLFFNAVITDNKNNSNSMHEISFTMNREERLELMPFMVD